MKKPAIVLVHDPDILKNTPAIKALIDDYKMIEVADESGQQEFAIETDQTRFCVRVNGGWLISSYYCFKDGAPKGHDSRIFANTNIEEFVEDTRKLYKKFCEYQEYQQYHIDLMAGKIKDIPRVGG